MYHIHISIKKALYSCYASNSKISVFFMDLFAGDTTNEANRITQNLADKEVVIR